VYVVCSHVILATLVISPGFPFSAIAIAIAQRALPELTEPGLAEVAAITVAAVSAATRRESTDHD
jgi:hypothetical protein